MSEEQKQNLPRKVVDWLGKQGHPLEFFVNGELWKVGLEAHQGIFVRDPSENILREIDVSCQASSHIDDHLVRVEFVIECKWSRDKPWVLFTSPFSNLSREAKVCQTIGSLLGYTSLWVQAGDDRFEKLDLYSTPERGGFGGCQAFSDNRDPVFSAFQSVTGAAVSRAFNYDPELFGREPRRSADCGLPRSCVVVIPIVVVDGILFEAYSNLKDGSLEIGEIDKAQVFWRGSPSWGLTTTIHVVTRESFPAFASTLATESRTMVEIMTDAVCSMHAWLETGNEGDLGLNKVSRGVVGFPKILSDAYKARREQEEDPIKAI